MCTQGFTFVFFFRFFGSTKKQVKKGLGGDAQAKQGLLFLLYRGPMMWRLILFGLSIILLGLAPNSEGNGAADHLRGGGVLPLTVVNTLGRLAAKRVRHPDWN